MTSATFIFDIISLLLLRNCTFLGTLYNTEFRFISEKMLRPLGEDQDLGVWVEMISWEPFETISDELR